LPADYWGQPGKVLHFSNKKATAPWVKGLQGR